MPKRRRDGEFWESGQMNNRFYAQYYDRLVELATSMFEWTNLPDTVDERYLELVLFSHGQAVFFKDDVMGYLALSNMNQGNFDVYRDPKRRRAYGGNGYQCPLDENNSVLIYNNYLKKPSMLAARNYAEILYDLDRSIMVNAKAQKTPVLISCDESERLSMMNLYQKYDGNQPFIYGTKDIRPNSIQAISTGAPFVGKDLYELKTKYWNEALTALGISNINVQKKERLVSDEVTRMMGGTIASRYSRLEMRRKACKKINEMFGLDIDCNFREDYREADDETMFAGDTGGGGMKDQVIDLRTK
jgi:hypothetical protein